MIIITSEITIDESKWQAALDLAKSHVEQSRLDPAASVIDISSLQRRKTVCSFMKSG